MNLAEYHAHPAWSSSRKKSAATDTMLSYWAKNEDPDRKPFVPTESMQNGSLVDAYITDNDQFLDRYFVLPDDAPKRPTTAQLNAAKPPPATQALIRTWEGFQKQAGDRIIIPRASYLRCNTILRRLMADPEIGTIMERDVICSQEPHFWKDPGGVDCRYLPDLETADGGVWDLKLTRSANPHGFRAQSYSLGYDIQLAHYRRGYINKRGTEPTTVGIIAYEWEWPHNCCLFIATDELIEHGDERGDKAVADVLACRESGIWPSYGSAELKLPGYIKSGGDEPYPSTSDEIELF